MKKLCIIFIMIVQVSFAQDKDEVINNFINAVKSKKIIQYSMTFSFNDESKGETKISASCSIKIVPEDTVVGAYYNFKSEESQYIYSGNEFLVYYPQFHGDKIVKLLVRKKHPEEFFDQKFVMDGQTIIAPTRVKGFMAYKYSIIELMSLIKKLEKDTPCKYLPDTTINGYECNRLIFMELDTIIDNGREFWASNFAFDKKTNMPIYYNGYVTSQKQDVTQETKVFFTDFSFDAKNSKDLFSRKAFPKGYKFMEKPPKIKKEHLKIGTAVPTWELPTINDKSINLEKLKGRPVLLIFSEIGCVPCMLAIPKLNEIVNEYKNLYVLGIYPLDSKETLKKFAVKKEINYDILYNSKEVAKKYHVGGYPTIFLIDKDGILRYEQPGYGEGMKEIWVKEIEKVLN